MLKIRFMYGDGGFTSIRAGAAGSLILPPSVTTVSVDI